LGRLSGRGRPRKGTYRGRIRIRCFYQTYAGAEIRRLDRRSGCVLREVSPPGAPPLFRRRRPGTRCLRLWKGLVRRSSAGATTCRQPALAKPASFLFGGASPHPGLLIGCQCELETGLHRLASTAYSLCRLYLVERGTCRADREEEVGSGVPAGRRLPPVLGIPLDRPIPHKCHDASSGIVRPGTGCTILVTRITWLAAAVGRCK